MFPIPLNHAIDALFNCSDVSNSCDVSEIHHTIIWEIRLPRIIMAFVTGAGLAITGAILQSVTRNPLADPYLFGISSGSALGAVIVIASLSGTLIWGLKISITFGALIGGISSVLLMLFLAGNAIFRVERLLLSGVAVSFMLGALTSLVVYYSNPETASSLLFWMMGSFSNSSWNMLLFPIMTLLICFAIFVIFHRWISAIQAGDESAHSLGIPVAGLRLFLLIVCSVLTAVLVSQVGGIGFVGLMIPHICRFLFGTDILRVLFASLFVGGLFMLWVDLLARSILAEQVLPVGIVTSAIGSIFFFVILKAKRS